MRRMLDALYFAGGILAALCLLLITGLIVAQITGRTFEFVVPSANMLAGFLLGGAIFLALPYSFKAGCHIRVELATQQFSPRIRRAIDLLCHLAAAAITAYMTWIFGKMVVRSWQYGDVSDGLVGVPLWLPQGSFVIGLSLFLVALMDETMMLMIGAKRAADESGDDARCVE